MKFFSLFFNRLIGVNVIAMVILLLTGCTPTPPLEQIVDARSDNRLRLWKADVAGDFTRQEWQDFEVAVQEIKLQVMIAGEASGSGPVWAATLENLNGLTVRDVLEIGLGAKLARVTVDRDKFVDFVLSNQRLRVSKGDEASADYLATLREHQEHRIEIMNGHIIATQEILDRRGLAPRKPVAKKLRSAPTAPF